MEKSNEEGESVRYDECFNQDIDLVAWTSFMLLREKDLNKNDSDGESIIL